MKQVLIFPRGQLNAKDKERLSKSRIVAVEADDPSKVVMVAPSEGVSADMMTMCALEAMRGQFRSDIRSDFTVNLHNALKERQRVPSSPNNQGEPRHP